jgi:hypothetical protein
LESPATKVVERYPTWQSIQHFVAFRNGKLYYTENCTRGHGLEIRADYLNIQNKNVRTSHILYRYENGVWPLKGRINPKHMTKHFSITLDPELRELIIQQSRAKNLSMATIIRIALRQYFRNRQNALTISPPIQQDNQASLNRGLGNG